MSGQLTQLASAAAKGSDTEIVVQGDEHALDAPGLAGGSPFAVAAPDTMQRRSSEDTPALPTPQQFPPPAPIPEATVLGGPPPAEEDASGVEATHQAEPAREDQDDTRSTRGVRSSCSCYV